MSEIFGIKQIINDIYFYPADNGLGSKLKDLRN